jgi:hypothetical protein
MGKTLLHRLFGLGKIPGRISPGLEQEGIVLLEEGIGGSVIFRNFRAPGKRYSWRRSWFTGSLVLTRKRLAAFAFSKPLIDVPLGDDRIGELRCSLEGEAILCVRFDPSAFYEGWSGQVECRFSTPRARSFLEQIQERAAS